MDLPRNTFKQAIAEGRPQFGTWLMSAAPSTAEALGCVGFDFLVVDMEHVPIDTPQMIGILRTIAGTPASAITRVPWNDVVMVKRALDAGAQSLMFPFVQDEHEAARAVASTRYPPDGIRGAAFGVAHDDYVRADNQAYMRKTNAGTVLLPQIETADGLANVEEIAAVDGVDVLWVGHFDLTNSLGIPGQFDHPDYLAALDRVVKAAHANGKAAGFMAGSQAEAAMLVERGFRILAYGGDLWVYQDALRSGIEQVRTLR